MNITTRIYGLIDPRDGNVFYVGRTSMKLSQRLVAHCRDGRKKKSAKSLKIADILSTGLKPQIFEITSLVDAGKNEVYETEAAWIEFYGLTYQLTNSQSSKAGGTYQNSKLELTPELISRLGKESDNSLSIELGCSRKTIAYHREKLGIAPAKQTDRGFNFKQKRVLIPDWAIALMGIESDSKIAQMLGTSHNTISLERNRRGIPKSPKSNNTKLPDEVIALLGTMPDSELGELVGYSGKRISRIRRELKIPRNGRKGHFKKVTKQIMALLGTMPDKELAHIAGVHEKSINRLQKTRGIPRFLPSSQHNDSSKTET